MSRRKTTGVYETREELVSEILGMVSIGMKWPVIARRAGVSIPTAATILYHPEKR